jgi:sugar lactone lactonase YvrE
MSPTLKILVASVIAGLAVTSPAQVPDLNWPVETVSGGHGFTEGASLAPDGSIYFSDMDQGQILRFDPESGKTEVWNNRSGRSNGLFINGNTLYACEASGRSVVQYDLDRGPESRKVLASAFRGEKLGSPNDLTVIGPHLYFSEFWIEGFIEDGGTARQIFQNRVYSVNLQSGEVDTVEFDFDTPNGIAASPDGTRLFAGDINGNKLYVGHRFGDRIGKLHLLTDLAKLGLEGPDGMAVAEDGRIFLALYRSDCLLVLDPDGNPEGVLHTGPLTSNCVFAADGKTLYITADNKLKRVTVPPRAGSWRDVVLKKMNLLGHRNWVLVVDKAFPEQSSPGMTYLYVEQDLIPTLGEVLEMIESTTHVKPVIYRDRELEFLTEQLVPGIEQFKSESNRMLSSYEVNSLLHEDVFNLLDESASLFSTLVIKTSGTLPYTSVFMQLDCAYWGPGEETGLREKMDNQLP